MAITFEEEEEKKSSVIGNFIIGLIFIALLGAGGYFAYIYLAVAPPAENYGEPKTVVLDKKIFSDTRLDSLEFLPEIAVGPEIIGREDPFTPLSAKEKEDARKKGEALLEEQKKAQEDKDQEESEQPEENF